MYRPRSPDPPSSPRQAGGDAVAESAERPWWRRWFGGSEGFTCQVDGKYCSACEGLEFYGEYEDKRYCVLHYPAEKKNKEYFLQVKQSKLDGKDYDFGGTAFPEGTSVFKEFEFDADANFAGATFHGEVAFSKVTFKRAADFSKAEFEATGREKAKKEEEEAKNELKAGEKALKESIKANKELEEAKRKVKERRDADFDKAVFEEEGDFKGAIFKGEANFGGATFKSEANFSKVIFKGEARFRKATFERDADFSKAIFKGKASFRRTTFEGSVDFEEPSDSEQYSFNERVDFSMAIFEKRARFIERRLFDTNLESVTFRDALIEWPGNFSLDRVRLRPSWFIDTNVQGFRFTHVQWRGVMKEPPGSIEEEIEAIYNRRNRSKEKEEEEEESQVVYPHEVLSKTCRELSANAEDNHDYPLANKFHYWSLEALRKSKESRSRLGLIGHLYWALSGYGVRPGLALGVLFVIWVVFAALYVLVPASEFYVFSPSNSGPVISEVKQAAVYSLGAMARLNPEPKPPPGWFQFLVTFEGLLGPLQIGLFLLAIRRKVMR
jgi:uncharacterized protein YjbI with pentapeptide repeats